MAKLVRSASGQIVDWDKLKIKDKLSSKPVSIDVEVRKKFVDEKMHRRVDKLKNKPKNTLIDKEIKKIETEQAKNVVDSIELHTNETVVDISDDVVMPSVDGNTEDGEHINKINRKVKKSHD